MNTNEFALCAKMYSQMSIEFAEWLQEKLKEREWNYSDLAREAGITRGAVGNIMRGERQPGHKILDGISRAMDLPPETVYRAAGLLPDLPTPRDQYEEIIAHRLSQLDDDQISEVLKYLDFIASRDQKPVKVKETKPQITKNREGSRPPEVVK